MQATLPGIKLSRRSSSRRRHDAKGIENKLFSGSPVRARVNFNEDRAVELFRSFEAAYESGIPLYVDAVENPPEARALRGIENEDEKVNLLYVAISLDRNTVSETLYGMVRRAYDKDPSFVNVSYLASLSEGQFYAHLRDHFGVGMEKTKAQEVYQAVQQVFDEAKGDVREFLSSSSSIYDAAQRLESLPGFGPNLPRLLLHNLVEQNLISFEDSGRLGPKVDVHCQALSLAHGVAQVEDEGEVVSSWHLGAVLREGYDEVAKNGLIDGRLFNKVVWAVGSKSCSKRSWSVCRRECPLYDSCGVFPISFYSRTGYFLHTADARENRNPLRDGLKSEDGQLRLS